MSLLGIWAFRDSFIGDTRDDECEFLTSLRPRFLGEVDVHCSYRQEVLGGIGERRKLPLRHHKSTDLSFSVSWGLYLTLFRFRDTAHKEVIRGMLNH